MPCPNELAAQVTEYRPFSPGHWVSAVPGQYAGRLAGDAFLFEQGDEGHYTFTGPIDAAQMRERFAFPASIRVYDDGSIKASLNRVDIGQESPPLRFSFDGLPATTDPIQSPQALPELLTTDDGMANERLRQIIENRHPEPGR